MASTQDARAAREAKLDELHEKLTGAVESLVSGDDWRQALAFAARFRGRSFNNTLLIWVQQAKKKVPVARSPQVKFAEVALPSTLAPALEVRLPDGTLLRGGNAADLAKLVHALRSPGDKLRAPSPSRS